MGHKDHVVLGLNGGFTGGYQDVCAALLVNGELKAMVEEERLNRIKFSPSQLPFRSVHEVLRISGFAAQDIDAVALHGSSWHEGVDLELGRYLKHHFGIERKVRRYPHHHCHAASVFYSSGFHEAAVITLDNSGDGLSGQILRMSKGRPTEVVFQWRKPNSLGVFYSAITQYCGFFRESDEYKLMGLAAFGEPRADMFSDFLKSDSVNGYNLNTDYIIPIYPDRPSPSKHHILYSDILEKITGVPPRTAGEEFSQQYKDIAASAQWVLSKAIRDVTEQAIKQTGLRNICFAGGVCMNSRAMAEAAAHFGSEYNFYLSPFSGDMGISAGAAMMFAEEDGQSVKPLAKAYLGAEYTDQQIEEVLKGFGLSYSYCEDVVSRAADLLRNGCVLGWFQGRAEAGARALGNRSILADPTFADAAERVNRVVKFRESFRPFAPAVIEESASDYFMIPGGASPFMTMAVNAKDRSSTLIPSVVHRDKSARVQTVNQESNALFYTLLREVGKRSGHPVLLNTSLNTRNHPMAYKPSDALETFFTSGLDALFLGNYLLLKSPQE